MKSELNVASAFYPEFSDYLDGAVIEHFQVVVAESHYGSDHDRVSRMYAYRIHVFHAADSYGLVIGVSHYLEFDLLKTFYALFNQHLMHRGKFERVGSYFFQLRFVRSKSSSRASEGKRRSEHYGIADLFSGFLCFFYIIGYL